MKYNEKIKDIGRDIKKTLYSTYTPDQINMFLEECTKEEFTKLHEELKGIENQLKIALKSSRKKRFAEVFGGLALGATGVYLFCEGVKTDSYLNYLIANPEALESVQYPSMLAEGAYISLFLGAVTFSLGVFTAVSSFLDDSKDKALQKVVYPQLNDLEDTIIKYSK